MAGKQNAFKRLKVAKLKQWLQSKIYQNVRAEKYGGNSTEGFKGKQDVLDMRMNKKPKCKDIMTDVK